MGKIHVPGNVLVMFEGGTGETTDGYHSFDELYAHRCSLFVVLMLSTERPAWRSWENDEGKGMDGWFLAGIETAEGVLVTYHLPDHMWVWLDNTRVATLDQGPPWDGHTSEDVIHRLADWCKALGHKPEEASEETTVAPKETTVAPKETEEASEETTVAPKETEEASEETTVAPKETTVETSEETKNDDA